MGKCSICGQPTTNENHLYCHKCFMERNSEQTGISDISITTNALDQSLQFSENMIKGRIAETLIEQLFLTFGFGVYRYGMENTIPAIMKDLGNNNGDVALNIRRMPDFVVRDKSGKFHFIEVKFKADETFKFEDLKENYPYENAYIVLVSKKHIKCLTVSELRDGKEITPSTMNYLGKRREFDLDKEIVVEFCKFAVKFFKEV